MELSNTYVKIDLDAILCNYRMLKKQAGVPVMAVVKADAYGHGALAVSRLLLALGARTLAVANAKDALKEVADYVTVSNEEDPLTHIISDIENGKIKI